MDDDISNLKFPHRDDFDHELLKEIEAQFAITHPGMKVVFAGDLPGGSAIPEEILKSMDALTDKWREDFIHGRCTDCGFVMVDWKERMEDTSLPALAPEWGVLECTDKEVPPRLLCPTCNKLDDERGGPRLEPING